MVDPVFPSPELLTVGTLIALGILGAGLWIRDRLAAVRIRMKADEETTTNADRE